MSSEKIAFLWSGAGKISQFILSFVSSILIARKLSPEDYGFVGVLSLFVVISTLLVDSGFKDVLILNSKKNTNKEYTSVFFVNISIGILLYLLLYLLAPLLGSFFNNFNLVKLSRILFLSIIVNSLSMIPLTILTIKMNFKKIAMIDSMSLLFSSCLGLYMAYNGYRYWSLVFPLLFSSVLKLVSYWYVVGWFPDMRISFKFISDQFSFCLKLLLTRIFGALSSNLIPFLLGKFYSFSAVGFFNRANNFQSITDKLIVTTVGEVSFPILSNATEIKRLHKFKLLIKLSAMVTFPISVVLSVVSKPLILLLLSHKWYGSIEPLQILSFLISTSLLTYIISNILKIVGEINFLLRSSILKNIVTVLALLVSSFYGVNVLCYTFVVVNIFFYVFYIYYTSKVISYSFNDQLKDISPVFIISFVLYIVMNLINYVPFYSDMLLLMSQFFIASLVIVSLYYFFLRKEINYFLSIITNQQS